MTNKVIQDWHRERREPAAEMTVRLGTLFETLCQWTSEEDSGYALELGYHTLGLHPKLIGNRDLVDVDFFPGV